MNKVGFAVPAGLMMAAAVGVWAPAASACSTCKCGDNTINLFGTEKAFEQRLRVGIDTLLRSEAQGDPAENERKTDEWRSTLGLSYSPTRDLSVALLVPYVRKQIEDSNLSKQKASGLGDIDLIGRYVLYRSGGGSGRHLAGLRLGVRLPTAAQLKDGAGEKLDIDVQPDAGATAPNVGGWYSYFRFPWFVGASLTYFHFGDGHQDFSPGDAVVGSLLTQYGLTQNVAVQLGVDARHAQKNRFGSVSDDDSGGELAMLFAGVALRFATDFIVSAGTQLPVYENLNGHQDEKPTLRLGLAYDFNLE